MNKKKKFLTAALCGLILFGSYNTKDFLKGRRISNWVVKVARSDQIPYENQERLKFLESRGYPPSRFDKELEKRERERFLFPDERRGYSILESLEYLVSLGSDLRKKSDEEVLSDYGLTRDRINDLINYKARAIYDDLNNLSYLDRNYPKQKKWAVEELNRISREKF